MAFLTDEIKYKNFIEFVNRGKDDNSSFYPEGYFTPSDLRMYLRKYLAKSESMLALSEARLDRCKQQRNYFIFIYGGREDSYENIVKDSDAALDCITVNSLEKGVEK